MPQMPDMHKINPKLTLLRHAKRKDYFQLSHSSSPKYYPLVTVRDRIPD